MWNSSRQWIAAALVWVAAWASPARAGYDSFGLGSGQDGVLTVTEEGRVVNRYAQVVAAIAPGATTVDVQSASDFQKGDLILVHQTTGLLPVPASGSSTTITLNSSSTSPVGLWELATVASVSGTRLTLAQPLINGYTATGAQVVLVPEYESVQIEASASIVARPWNGSVGGIVAFLVKGTLSSDGTISASGAGFRGGAYVRDTSGAIGCSGLDEAAPRGGQKGEGIALRYGPSVTGRGNVSTGGGGGVCTNAGGGGGSHYGAGGQGGYSHSTLDGTRNVGGLGGVAVSYVPAERLLLGGGGGAGHGRDGKGGAGGDGGGIVFIRANLMKGSGTVVSDGTNAKVVDSGTDAASGGGAGGSIYLRLVDNAVCSTVRASGGAGGDTNAGSAYVGPGGGGGGGYVLFQAKPGAYCPVSTPLGFYGYKQDDSAPYGLNYGAAAGRTGAIFPPSSGYRYGFIIPPVPTVREPQNGQWSKTGYIGLSTTGPTGETGYIQTFVNGAKGQTITGSNGSFNATLGPIPDGQYVIEFASVVDYAWSTRSAAYTVYVDTVAPSAPVVSAPAAGSVLTSRRPTLSGTAEALSTVHVFLNDSEVGTATVSGDGSWSFAVTAALADGDYRAKARAVDRAGNEGAYSQVRTFSVQATAPTTTIEEAPPAHTDQTSATFRFSADNASATFECSLDGAAFTACQSPLELSGLSVGTHTLQIRARDSRGNVEDPPARHSWTITSGTPDGGGDPGTPDGGGGGNPGTPDGGGDPGGGGNGGGEDPAGCGCSSLGFDPSMALLALAGLSALASRRRRRRRRQ